MLYMALILIHFFPILCETKINDQTWKSVKAEHETWILLFCPPFTRIRLSKGYSRKNPHPPARRMISFFNPPPSHLDFLKPMTPFLSGFPRQKTPPPAWISVSNEQMLEQKLLRLQGTEQIWEQLLCAKKIHNSRPRWKTKKILKNTKCEGVKVNQLFTFFTSIITQNNRDLTWNYLTVARWVWVRVKICQAFQTLRCNNVATVFIIVFSFSAVKGPVKELKLSFTSGEKNVKIFPLLSGSESAKVSPN